MQAFKAASGIDQCHRLIHPHPTPCQIHVLLSKTPAFKIDDHLTLGQGFHWAFRIYKSERQTNIYLQNPKNFPALIKVSKLWMVAYV